MSTQSSKNTQPYSIVLYDHSCNLCRREMANLKKRDHLQRLLMIDISHPDFDAQIWGFEMSELNAALHVKTTAGEWIKGMAAIRYVYQQVGLGWVWWPSKLPLLSGLSNYTYAWFARNRHRLSAHFCEINTTADAYTGVNKDNCGGQAKNGGVQ